MNKFGWLKWGISAVLVLLFAASVALGLLALGNDGNKEAGIATVQVRQTPPQTRPASDPRPTV